MCGICGIFGRPDKKILSKMSETISYRGPDDYGTYSDELVSLAARRLSILDIPNGKQPMSNDDGSIVLVFNGEIYNYQVLRKDLSNDGYQFRTESDTEVVIQMYHKYGKNCFSMFDGQFAIALYNRNLGELVLARDHFGIKPLYYTIIDGTLYFSSEAKSFSRSNIMQFKINKAALIQHQVFGYILNELTFFDNISQIKPGSYVVFSQNNSVSRQFWQNRMIPGVNSPNIDKISDSIQLSVLERFDCSHVPVGVELSGGMDSSLICKILSVNERPFVAYTADMDNDSEDSRYARKLSKQIGFDQKHVHISRDQLDSCFPEYIYATENLNVGGIFHHILSRESKRKVLLCGQGADEVFGSYKSVLAPRNYLQSLKNMCQHAKTNMTLDTNAYLNIHSIINRLQIGSVQKNVLFFEQKSQLQNFMLLVDRALYHGKEVRVPYLKREIVEYVNSLPITRKVSGTNGKILLKQAAIRLGLDKSFIERKKITGPNSTQEYFDYLNRQTIRNYKGPLFSSARDQISYKAMEEIFVNGRNPDFGLNELL